ncbi:MAG: 30S ribosomal protein S15 [Enterobacteriaceae bacterium PC38]|nr:MAG: 30S ribosomal protein S15 [Enterobacteriaceae bacterium PC38]
MEKKNNYIIEQINILNKKIKNLKIHFLINKKDQHSRIGLSKKIMYRKKILKYFKNNNFKKYTKFFKKNTY